ncbi:MULTISPECIES: acyl-CoA dehydrogenase family protein [unclassified Cupriavidus]|uniref:acyl-CoA dehydrogenase family protein n=1 Tax=unclassified Cupriavidus TaxID=2640874 RepID=UPI001C005B97|nr:MULTISPECIES: acyl-CoA dehydrogenase family protein [unclassified Cupriavidus]MCA3188860.1 acyl-CoA dehydrogenase family protein [Cupriavidus sp.]MCA3198580.1 acyl-CoA dehydrogenase family protein [Cupriavidus sp.]MCA3201326.1 acyl-CoA dehydrogenase family protein [Cupriavidus sp.]MCA3209806.1 acyl-CoA dehydrogenase family protein [Cupriavidus sp.]MCA3234285.1 acyl-CoA dehydrogenase family protein [Cupriavidus sp.]
MHSLFGTFALTTLPDGAAAFRQQVKAFLRDHLPALPPDVRARSWMGFDAGFSRALAQRGWVGITLPAQYGGAGLDAFSRFVLVEELLACGAPVSAHWIADRQSGPLILRYGSDAQRAFYLPRICRGEAFFCIGMSEPNSGSDLASVATRAVPLPDGGWRLNGRKIWTTNADRCHFMLALVRTSGEAGDRQKGLSQVIVDLSLPGVTVRPIHDLAGDAHFSEVSFEDVLLPADALVGQEGAGWEQVNAELAFERSGPERLYSSVVLLDAWMAVLRRLPAVQRDVVTIGRIMAQLATLRAMSLAVTARLAAGESPLVEAALIKDLGTGLEQSIGALAEAALGDDADLAADADLYRTAAYVSQISPTYSLRGGTREILRGMIARGLGLR